MKDSFITVSVATKVLGMDGKELRKVMALLPSRISPDKKFLTPKAIKIIQVVNHLAKRGYSYSDAIEEVFKPRGRSHCFILERDSQELSLFDDNQDSKIADKVDINRIKESLIEVIKFLGND